MAAGRELACAARLRSGRAAARGCGRAEGFFSEANWGVWDMLLGRETGAGPRIGCTLRTVSGPRGSAGAQKDFSPRLNGGGLGHAAGAGNIFICIQCNEKDDLDVTILSASPIGINSFAPITN